MKEQIKKIEGRYGISISPFTDQKTGYEEIAGLHQSFVHFEKAVFQIEQDYEEFFAGITHTPVKVKHTQVMGDIAWFIDMIDVLTQKASAILSTTQKATIRDLRFEMIELQAKFQTFATNHREQFGKYTTYTERLKNGIDFLDPDQNFLDSTSYISFNEFTENSSQMTDQERANTVNQIRADIISGKFKL